MPDPPLPDTLVLCDLRAPALPPFPGAFALLRHLDLSGNGLEELPGDVDVLASLQTFFLGGGEEPNRSTLANTHFHS